MHGKYKKLAYFFVVSIALHMVLLLPWSTPRQREHHEDPIPVSLVPLREQKTPPPAKTPNKIKPNKRVRKPEIRNQGVKPAPKPVESSKKTKVPPASPKHDSKPEKKTTPSRSKATASVQAKPVAKKKLSKKKPRRKAPMARVAKKRAPPAQKETRTPPKARPAPKENREDSLARDAVVRRPLPSLKELLPRLGETALASRRRHDEETVNLDSRDPRYLSYLETVKRAIDRIWEYPEIARRRGLQGVLMMEFTILESGELLRLRLIRSSGHHILDDEALRAVRLANPFQRFPPWIRTGQLNIVATFEYVDRGSRLRYTFQ